MWSPEAICLKRVVCFSVAAGISSGFSREQMFHFDRSLPLLPQLASFHDNEIIVYCNNYAAPPRHPSRQRRGQSQPPAQKAVRNTHLQCCEFHNEGMSVPSISTFPHSCSLPHIISPAAALEHFHESTVALLTQYDHISKQSVETRDKDVCRKIITDTENMLADDQIHNLSATHKRYLRDKLRKAISQVRTLYQEAATYDQSSSSIKRSPVVSILPFLIRRHRLDNKEQPD